MDSFDSNLSMIDPWMFTSTIADSFYPDAFARETESALTKALQQSLFNQSEVVSPSFFVNQTDSSRSSASTVTASGSGSGSDPETPGSKRFGSKIGVSIGKTTKKRKSRASKRSATTFIEADPADFRRMVQEVTGAKLEGDGKLPVTTAEKPRNRRRFINEFQGILPTLDTSANFVEVQNGDTRRIPAAGSTSTANVCSKVPATSRATGKGVAAIDFYSLCSFPTLESSS
ncbi:hypothetical protein SSX86_011166 [Deinandra increscens subsp. villosa]|uniref:VQ domain-containing protein n=1 Tax=Deinandra increscens subsp. villosa TaxID=3103831 RepID=A0AAP0DGQ4_9ASTR